MSVICKTLDQVQDIAKELLSKMDSGIVILQGDLAAGKTTLVQAIALALNVKEAVTSPTFSLQQCYDKQLYHYDMYNHGLEQFMSLGLFEELEKDGLHLIEWGDNQLVDLLNQAGFSVLKVQIEKQDNKRCYTMTKIG